MSTEEMFSRLKLDEEVEILLCAALTLGAPQSAVWAVAQQIGAFSNNQAVRQGAAKGFVMGHDLYSLVISPAGPKRMASPGGLARLKQLWAGHDVPRDYIEARAHIALAHINAENVAYATADRQFPPEQRRYIERRATIEDLNTALRLGHVAIIYLHDEDGSPATVYPVMMTGYEHGCYRGYWVDTHSTCNWEPHDVARMWSNIHVIGRGPINM